MIEPIGHKHEAVIEKYCVDCHAHLLVVRKPFEKFSFCRMQNTPLQTFLYRRKRTTLIELIPFLQSAFLRRLTSFRVEVANIHHARKVRLTVARLTTVVGLASE